MDAATVERWRLLLWGLPGLALVFSAVCLEPWLAARRWCLLRLTGDASYALYLSHGFVLPVCGVLLARVGAGGPAAIALGAIVAVAGSLLVGGATGRGAGWEGGGEDV